MPAATPSDWATTPIASGSAAATDEDTLPAAMAVPLRPGSASYRRAWSRGYQPDVVSVTAATSTPWASRLGATSTAGYSTSAAAAPQRTTASGATERTSRAA